MARLIQYVSFVNKKLPFFQIYENTVLRRYANKAGSTTTSDAPAVSGLSSAVYKMPTGEVGPGASKTSEYKNPEYFCYHSTSYFEAEIEMLKYRLPQPSNKSSK